jgi:hypothetical protein
MPDMIPPTKEDFEAYAAEIPTAHWLYKAIPIVIGVIMFFGIPAFVVSAAILT